MTLTIFLTAVLSLLIWLYLFFFRGGFWRLSAFDDDGAEIFPIERWPSVVAIVPARNEAETIGKTVEALVGQQYQGAFSIVVVDDHSEDDTAALAQHAAFKRAAANRVAVHSAGTIPAGWTGKLWALNEGVQRLSQPAPEFYWFTDADVVHSPDTLRRLVSRAMREQLDLASLMVLLRAETLAERAFIPAFLYFFLKLYPPRWTADRNSTIAGAAGGCILLRHEALRRIGGLPSIHDQVIDDCALANAVKKSGARIWMGLTRKSVSLRSYNSAGEIRDMIARTAFTQLRYSPALLLGTLAGMFITYLAPPLLLFSHNFMARGAALIAFTLMTISFIPTVRFYRLRAPWALLLPIAALFYSYATWLSALRYWLGRGGEWKGRAQATRGL